MPFSDQIAAGKQLIRDALQSAGYVAGTSGWSINKNGTAEFASAVIRGLVEILGASGAKIRFDNTSSYPQIKLISPDGTNQAFLNLFSGLTPADLGKAQLGINSGVFTPADGVARRWRIFAQDDNVIIHVMRLSDQSIMGGFLGQSSTKLQIGVADPAGTYTFLDFTKGSNLMTISGDGAAPVNVANGGFLMPSGILINRKTNAVLSSVSADTKDSGVGDQTFTAYTGRTYEVGYYGRGIATTAAAVLGVVVRDGGASSPTATSPVLGSAGPAADVPLAAAGGAAAETFDATVFLDCPADIAVGVHKIAPFYRRTSGTGTVAVDQSSGSKRGLYVIDVGGQ